MQGRHCAEPAAAHNSMAKPRADSDAPLGDSGSSQGAVSTAKAAPPPKAAPPKRRRNPLVFLILLILVGGLAYTAYAYWLANRDYETTDDAFIDGRAITIAPQVSGNVVS